ncbi:hypothetical protein ACKFKF_19460 [Phormidesmis sp. 146-12]
MIVDRLLQFQFRRIFSLGTSATGLAILLGGGGLWMINAAIVPQQVRAYETRVDVGLDRLPNEAYQTLVQRAEQVARAAAQRSFDRDILISQVSVIVIGRNQGAEAPILTLDVSRVEWKNRPDTRRWATYYRTAPALLGFDGSTPTVFSPPAQPVPAPVTAPVTPPVQAVPSTPQSPVPPGVTPPTQRVTPPAQTTDENGNTDEVEQPEDEEQ